MLSYLVKSIFDHIKAVFENPAPRRLVQKLLRCRLESAGEINFKRFENQIDQCAAARISQHSSNGSTQKQTPLFWSCICEGPHIHLCYLIFER